jgi:hypothetical protein
MKVEQGFLYNVKILWSKSAVKLRLQFKIFEKKNKKTYDQTKGAHKEAIQGFRDVSASVRWWNVHSTLTGSEVRP